MNAAGAIDALTALKREAERDRMALYSSQAGTAWRANVKSLLVRSLGPDSDIPAAFSAIRYGLVMTTDGTPDSAWQNAFLGGLSDAIGYIDAALYELRMVADEDDVLEAESFDAELWKHVAGLVGDEDWGKVASQTAIFVESRLRVLCGSPKDAKGDDLTGKVLWAKVLSDDSDYRHGARQGEREGWRFLGMGFTQALSNVDRHHITERVDAKAYAVGVLGLGSLLLTQLRHEHAAILES